MPEQDDAVVRSQPFTGEPLLVSLLSSPAVRLPLDHNGIGEQLLMPTPRMREAGREGGDGGAGAGAGAGETSEAGRKKQL
eukprot:421646-Hanusia_phi.AAC.3